MDEKDRELRKAAEKAYHELLARQTTTEPEMRMDQSVRMQLYARFASPPTS